MLDRFRVLAYCSDTSGAAAIVFQDKEVRQILGKSVFDIQAEYPEVKKLRTSVYYFVNFVNE